MVDFQPLKPAMLATFPGLCFALDSARKRLGEDDDFEVINSPEVWAAFLLFRDEDIGDDGFTVCTSENAPAVFAMMSDVCFVPLSSQHLAFGLCLFAVIHLRGGV
ncbi:MAG: hypothetical protein JJU07_16155 [Natronohydrobacter sp.]|nr:hypothetical protein [Natronohydrobacter sp.]